MIGATLSSRAPSAQAPCHSPGGHDVLRLANAITAWIEADEAVFLDAGSRLRSVHGRLARVRDGIGRSTELLSADRMASMREDLARAAGDAGRIETLSGERADALAGLRTAIADAAVGAKALRGVFKTLDYVALIARVQVERMRSRHEELVPFAMHVDELVDSGEKVVRVIDQRMEALCGQLDGSRTVEDRRSDEATGPALIDGFMQLVTLIESQQREAGRQREDAGRSFTALWQAIAQVVMGLQAHDMVRQRFEHTARNLAIFADLAADGTLGDGGEPLAPHLRPAARRRIVLLEIAQIEDLSEVYNERTTKIRADLGSIATELGGCTALLGRLMPERSGQGGLGQLDAEASRLREGFHGGREAREKTTESVERSVVATQSLIELTNRLVELEYELRLAGFNAAVRAAHVDGGDETISYVAGVIREQASKARDMAEQVRNGIESAASVTESLSQRILPTLGNAESSVETALTSAATLLSDAEASCRTALAESTEAAQGLGPEVEDVHHLMSASEDGGAMMQALGAALAACLAELAAEDLPEDDAARLDRVLTASYTMEEERAVHARCFGLAPVSAIPAPSPAPAGDDDFDDILF
ncbi:hypothetical protein [Aureimonas psammosilenae]|uniref:hypothetical protein n=1 Tax=Aureimonas psammosilenae TaxID=2495496 RepID=UPI0012606A98|nr:hypothetical protein [Aureimonas psammosilenae]